MYFALIRGLRVHCSANLYALVAGGRASPLPASVLLLLGLQLRLILSLQCWQHTGKIHPKLWAQRQNNKDTRILRKLCSVILVNADILTGKFVS